MKKIILLLLFIPSFLIAKEADDSKYLLGAVPEVNGIVTFQKSFKVANKSKQEIHNILQPWIKAMVDNSASGPGPYARILQDSQDTIAARVVDMLTFKKKPLYLDESRLRYQINVIISNDGRVNITATSITYHYGYDPHTDAGGTLIRAEEWITDKEAVNKAGTKLYPKSGKFRRMTIDRMEELFESAMDAFLPREEKAPEVVKKKQRVGIVED